MSVTRKSVRVVAFDANNVHHLRTVNIRATLGNVIDPHRSIKEFVQVTAAQAANMRSLATVMAAPSLIAGLPTVFISGYTAPN